MIAAIYVEQSRPHKSRLHLRLMLTPSESLTLAALAFLAALTLAGIAGAVNYLTP